MAYEGNPKEAVEIFVGSDYVQHNPSVTNGKEGLIEYFERMAREYPDKKIEFVRVIAEDNLVALQTHQTWPGKNEYVTMDFFRFDKDGKIVEHWDSIHKIPNETANNNTMYWGLAFAYSKINFYMRAIFGKSVFSCKPITVG